MSLCAGAHIDCAFMFIYFYIYIGHYIGNVNEYINIHFPFFFFLISVKIDGSISSTVFEFSNISIFET